MSSAPKPVALNVHAALLKAAAERDPRVATRLTDILANKLDRRALLQVLTLHQQALSVSLHALADLSPAKDDDESSEVG